jgi:tetratricopeptide (TPR) repeat protein
MAFAPLPVPPLSLIDLTMAQEAKNAVEKRLEIIVSRWQDFCAEEDPRLLRWLGDADDAKLLDVFLEVENDENGSLPDLFIRIEVPFTRPDRYGFQVIESLKQKFEEMRPDAAEIGITTDWVGPVPAPGDTDVKALVEACTSFRAHYKDLMETLVLVFFPDQVADISEWQKWLFNLVRVPGLASETRFMVLDDLKKPRLNPLCQAEPKRIQTKPLELDLPAAMNETAASANDGSAGTRFRKHFVGLSTAGSKGDLAGADSEAKQALAIAEKEQWPQMKVVVYMSLGAALVGASKFDEAIKNYGAAEKTAAESQKTGDPVGGKLRVQAKLSIGSAHIAAGQFPQAGKVYEETAPLALENNDARMELESWRMAAYCREVGKDWEGAWKLNYFAFKAGEKMKPEERESSTLPYVGQALTRVNNKLKKTDGAALKKHLDKTLGEGWEKKIERGATPA